MKALTEKQAEVLACVVSHIRSKGFPPTMREIAAVQGCDESNVRELLGRIERKGYIRRNHGKRCIEVRSLPIAADPRFTFVPVSKCAICERAVLQVDCPLCLAPIDLSDDGLTGPGNWEALAENDTHGG